MEMLSRLKFNTKTSTGIDLLAKGSPMRRVHVLSSLMDKRKEKEWLELIKWKQRSEPIEKPSRLPNVSDWSRNVGSLLRPRGAESLTIRMIHQTEHGGEPPVKRSET